mmetsp:Transcript_66191/g.181452  ORF Transcript_66191/g.181452 Transcript_66191/m.181452 type:complete len:169 (+) Transcript_66191:732-1238(+)
MRWMPLRMKAFLTNGKEKVPATAGHHFDFEQKKQLLITFLMGQCSIPPDEVLHQKLREHDFDVNETAMAILLSANDAAREPMDAECQTAQKRQRAEELPRTSTIPSVFMAAAINSACGGATLSTGTEAKASDTVPMDPVTATLIVRGRPRGWFGSDTGSSKCFPAAGI